MGKRTSDRMRCGAIAGTVTLAAATGGYVTGTALAGDPASTEALVVALVASWVGMVVLGLLPRVVVADRAGDGSDRTVDPISGLLRYDPALDDAYVCRSIGLPWAVLVVEVDAHVTASAFDPDNADALIAEAAERVSAVGASYGAIVRRLDGPQLAVVVTGLEDAALRALAMTLHDGGARTAARGRLVVGVAVATDGRGEVPMLIRSASTAATQAKRSSSESPVFFHARLVEDARERLVLGRALRAAIDARAIDIVYQPQVDLTDGALLGVEVLARWHDPVLGPIEPDRFVRIAAEVGLAYQLDRLIAEKALAQLSAWDRAGIRVPRLSINVTPETITQERSLAVQRLLELHDIAPHRLTVEVIESRIFEDNVGSAAVQRFRDLGVRVALDDFGSGQSSFTQLVSLPVTGLKIDRSLLSDRDVDESVLGAIIQAGTALGLAVGAVGVETMEQRDLLQRLGCVMGQGYLFSPPLTADELANQLGAPMPVGPVRVEH